MSGVLVYTSSISFNNNDFIEPELTSGVYIIEIVINGNKKSQKLIIN